MKRVLEGAVCLLLLGLLFLGQFAFGQAVFGNILGTVTDPSAHVAAGCRA
jgi:hypothetical protein